MKYGFKKSPAGKVNHWTHHETSTPFLLKHRKGSGKCLIEWLLEENQESLAAEAPHSQFGTLSTNVKASVLEDEGPIDSFVQNLKRLELCLSNVCNTEINLSHVEPPKKFSTQYQKLLTNCLVLLVPSTTKLVIFPIKYAVSPKLKSM